jgi:AbrB family looped-hinge helix DNA binding protein
VEQTSGHEHKIYQSKIDKSGRIVLPADVRAALGVSEGDSVLVVHEGQSVEIVTSKQAVRPAQDYFMKLAPPDLCMSDELIRERREEAARERE